MKSIVSNTSAIRKSLLVFVLVATLTGSAFATAAPAYAECSSTYVVKGGDTLGKIATAHNVTLTNLANTNNITNLNLVYVGQSLCIPKGGSSSPSTTPNPTSTAQPSSSSNFSATHTASELNVQVKNYSANSSFYVRVQVRTSGDLTQQWEKIGSLQTDKNGAGSSKLTLPAALKNASSFSVCLKNIANNNQTCTTSTKGTTSNSGSDSTASGSFTAAVKRDSKLTINTNGLPKNSSFFVRVRDAKSTSANAWVRVGTLSTGSNGSVTASFDLPSSLQKYATLSVCLKNVSTNAVLCTSVSTNK